METPWPARIPAVRVLEAMREIGVLLTAFAPLDFAVGGAPVGQSWPYLLGFLVAGVFLLTSSIILEWRLQPWLGSS